MANAATTIASECGSLLSRHGKLGKRKNLKLKVYAASLEARLIQACYARECIELNLTPSTAVDPFPDQLQKVEFYTTCFWTLSYSVFDILAHVLHTIYPIPKFSDESRVSFLRAVEEYEKAPHSLPGNLLAHLKGIKSKNFFKLLKSYRQCGLHRRSVCLKSEVTTMRFSPGYSTLPTVEATNYVICDNADELSPAFKRNRLLLPSCDKQLQSVTEYVVRALGLV